MSLEVKMFVLIEKIVIFDSENIRFFQSKKWGIFSFQKGNSVDKNRIEVC